MVCGSWESRQLTWKRGWWHGFRFVDGGLREKWSPVVASLVRVLFYYGTHCRKQTQKLADSGGFSWSGFVEKLINFVQPARYFNVEKFQIRLKIIVKMRNKENNRVKSRTVGAKSTRGTRDYTSCCIRRLRNKWNQRFYFK